MFTRNSSSDPQPFEPRTARHNGAQASISAPSSGKKSVIGNDLKIIGQGLKIISRRILQVDGEIGSLFSYERTFKGRSLSAIATMIQVEIEQRGAPNVKTTPPVSIGMKGIWFHGQQENEAFLIVLSLEDGKLEAANRYENLALRNQCLAK